MSGLVDKVKGMMGKGEEERGHMAHETTDGECVTCVPNNVVAPSYTTEGVTEKAAAQEAAITEKPAMAQTVTTAVAAPAEGVAQQGQAAVCGQEYFTKTEDRPAVLERKEYIKEHRPVQKEFVVETRATGVERELTEGRVVEHLGTTERIVSAAQPKGPCE